MRLTHIERPALLEEPALFYLVKISSEADISTVLGSMFNRDISKSSSSQKHNFRQFRFIFGQ